jgi:bacillolysin
MSGAIDIVAHEYAHGVIDASSALRYRNEAGALSEAFADIMATGAEFYSQKVGSGRLLADYLVGEDVVSGGGLRSLEDPRLHGNPAHYADRYTGIADNGGVHVNSTIVSHAYFLAVEGGTDRSSDLPAVGVGHENRAQIEKIFYRAFVYLLPSGATFATARAATIQAARDLFGSGHPAERAIVQAWRAVGVE